MTVQVIDYKLPTASSFIYSTPQRKPSFKVILNVIQETTSKTLNLKIIYLTLIFKKIFGSPLKVSDFIIVLLNILTVVGNLVVF